MDVKKRLDLIKQVGEEIVTEEELMRLLKSKESLVAYDGFEPSGRMHIAQGILRSINVNKMIKAGVNFKMLVADWHALANNKMGGDLEKIQTVGKYFIEVWKAVGMDTEAVDFVWASDLVKDPDYWLLVLKIARTNTIRRFIRTAEIMGREESMDLSAAQIIYPCMQTADIFTLGAQITQLGMDQRKVNMLAREVGEVLGFWKPVVVSHHMLLGLGRPFRTSEVEENPPAGGDGKTSEVKDKLQRTLELKMSKSHPDSAIFMTDSENDVKRKVEKAWCPEGEVKNNPILEYSRYILFESFDKITIKRPKKYGGAVKLSSYQDLEKMFEHKKIHPQDLKNTVSSYLNRLLEPVRNHFQKDKKARQLLEEVKSFRVTR